jgi:hypothetical protein
MAVRGQARIKPRVRLCALDGGASKSNLQQPKASRSLSGHSDSCKNGVCSIDSNFVKTIRESKVRATDSM